MTLSSGQQDDMAQGDAAGDAAYQKLREAILVGDISPGKVASQAELVTLLNVTRSPLREALRILRDEGLVTHQPNRRVRIAPLTIDDLEQLYAMRLSLEGGAIRLTVPRLTADDFGEAAGLLATMDHFAQNNDWQRLRAPHRAFHMLFVAGIGDEGVALMARLFDRTERYRHAYWGSVPSYWDRGREEHQAILSAAQAGDPGAAALALARHYSSTAAAVVEAIAPGHDWSRLHSALEFCAGQPLT